MLRNVVAAVVGLSGADAIWTMVCSLASSSIPPWLMNTCSASIRMMLLSIGRNVCSDVMTGMPAMLPPAAPTLRVNALS